MDVRNLAGQASSAASNLGGTIAANPQSAAAIGAAATYAAFKATEFAYKKYKKKKHLAEIERVIALFKKHLDKLKSRKTEDEDPAPLPMIFTQSTTNPEEYNSVNVSPAIMLDMKNKVSLYDGQTIQEFRKHIKDAIGTIYEYYTWRLEQSTWYDKKTPDDTTSCVLCYIVLMLSEHCIAFQGIYDDITYVRQLRSFLLEWISDHERKNSKLTKKGHETQSSRFAYLNPAVKSLERAQATLENNLKNRNPQDYIREAITRTTRYSEDLKTLFLKLLLADDAWKKLDSVRNDLLVQGIVTKEKKYKVFYHLIPKKDDAICLPDNVFSQWIMQYAKAEDAISSSNAQKWQGINLDIQQYKAPNYFEPLKSRLKTIEANFAPKEGETSAEKKQRKKLKDEAIDHCKSTYKEQSQDLDKLIDFIETSPILTLFRVPISEEETNQEFDDTAFYSKCIRMMSTLMMLLACDLALRSRHIHLKEALGKQGEDSLMYAQNRSHHFPKIRELSVDLLSLARQLKDDFKELRERAGFQEISYSYDSVLTAIDENLDGQFTYLTKAVNEVLDLDKDDRHNHKEAKTYLPPHPVIAIVPKSKNTAKNNKTTAKSTKHSTQTITKSLSTPLPTLVALSKTLEPDSPKDPFEDLNIDEPGNDDTRQTSSNGNEQKEGEPSPTAKNIDVKIKPKTTPREEQSRAQSSRPPSLSNFNNPIVATPIPNDDEEKEHHSDPLSNSGFATAAEALSAFDTQIELLEKAEGETMEVSAYRDLYRICDEMDSHGSSLNQEEKTHRQAKGRAIQRTALHLAEKCLDFISIHENERIEHFSVLSRDAEQLIKKNEHIDTHPSGLNQFGNAMKNVLAYPFTKKKPYEQHFRLFQTSSRDLVDQFNHALQRLNEALKEKKQAQELHL